MFQSNEFIPLQFPSENLGIHWDSNSQNGSSFRSVRVHSLTLFCTPRSMKCDSQGHSWPTPSQALALVASPRLGLQQLHTYLGLTHPTIAHSHVVNVNVPLMIWVSTCFGVYAKMYTLQHMIFFGILSQLLLWKMEHTFKKRFPTFSPTTLGGESKNL